MTKDIKDYLHLYLGCEIEHDKGIYRGTLVGIGSGFLTAEIDCDFFKRNTHGHKVPKGKDFGTYNIQMWRLKPILRKLSDITEEEARVILPDMQTEDKLIEWGYYNEYSDGNVFYQYLKKAEDERLSSIIEDSLGVPEHWLFLLSKGFDLFGLIEAGLAIDITKLNKEK